MKKERKSPRKFAYKYYDARKYLFCVHCLCRKRGRRNMDIFDLFRFWFWFCLYAHQRLLIIYIHFVRCALILTARDFCLPRCGCAFYESYATSDDAIAFFSFFPLFNFRHSRTSSCFFSVQSCLQLNVVASIHMAVFSISFSHSPTKYVRNV